MRKILITMLFIITAYSHADADNREADREALRAILDNMVKALNAQDFEMAAKNLDPSGVITYYNAEVTVGHAAGRKYFNRMLKETKAVVKEYRLTGDVSAPAIFHGDTAIAYGVTEEYFKLREGLEFTLNGHWSVALTKQEGEWKIVNLHFSANLFDNPLLNTAKKMQWIIGIAAFIIGLLVMFVAMRFMRKK